VIDEHDLVGLLHRADWTLLSLSAEVSNGSSVLIAPGRRYRYQSADYVTGCDGGRPWELPADDEDPDGSVHWVSGPRAPLPRLLCPDWLLEDYALEVEGPVRAWGRDAFDVVVTERGQRDGSAGPIRVVVDAELGILIRIAEPSDGKPEVTELIRPDFDPVIDPDQFAAPPGSRIAESAGEALGAVGPALWAAKTAGGLAAGALGAWMKYSPTRRSKPAADGVDFETAIPADGPPPDLSPDRVPAGPPVSDELLSVLYAGGPAEFAATLHRWISLGALASSVPAGARRAGFGGLGLLMDAVAEVPATGHLVSRIRIAGQGRYQIDHAYQPKRGPVTIACDGERRFQVYSDRITTGPAGPLPSPSRYLADPSWLLRCWLSGGATVPGPDGGGPARRINAGRRPGSESLTLMYPAAVAVVDPSLGLVLRLTSYIGARPVQRLELRDVSTDVGDFQVNLPSGLPVVAESRPSRTR
jgi:hypothetical protein